MEKVRNNFLYNLIYHVVSLIIPFVVNPYITRTISQGLLGRNTFICAQITYFCLFGSLGINYLGTREIAKAAQDGLEKIRERFYSLVHLQFLTYAAACGLFVGYLLLFPDYLDIKLMYILMIAASMTDINWLYMGIEDFRFISIRNCLIRIICTALVFLLVKNDGDIYLYIICLYLPQLILNLMMWVFAIKRLGKDSFAYRIRREDFRRNIILAIPGIAVSVYTILDKLVIGLFQPVESVAIYDQGQALVRMVLSAIAAFGTVVMPRVSSMVASSEKEMIQKAINKCAAFTWLLASALMFGLISVAGVFISWYLPDNYSYVANVMIITSPLILISSAENVMGVQVLIPHGGEKYYSISLVAAAITNLTLDLLFVPRYGIAAACICSVIAEGIALAIQTFYARRYVDPGEVFGSSIYFLICGGAMWGLLAIINNHLATSPQLRTMILVVSGGIFYLLLCGARKLTKGSVLGIE